MDDVTEVEANEKEDGEVVAEGQRVATQTAHGTKQHPAKQGEMRREEGADESGGEVRGSAYTQPDEAMNMMAPPPSPKRTKS